MYTYMYTCIYIYIYTYIYIYIYIYIRPARGRAQRAGNFPCLRSAWPSPDPPSVVKRWDSATVLGDALHALLR